MNPPEHDPLFDTTLPPSAELAELQRLLKPLRANVPARMPPALAQASQRSAAPRRWAKHLAQAAAVLLLLAATGFAYRLHWRADEAWALENGARWQVGTPLSTPQAVSVRVARIGQLQFAPGAQTRLLASHTGKHRIALNSGMLHARIWAPPAWFAVQVGQAEIVDLGCEFTLEVQAQRSELEVLSGWVAYSAGNREVLVPAGYRLSFHELSADFPVRRAADPAFAAALAQLHESLRYARDASLLEASIASVIRSSQDADAFSLLSVLTQYPKLASSALYPRMASVLQMPSDAAHRRAWTAGDLQAIERGWQQLPTEPKAWWRNWRDMW